MLKWSKAFRLYHSAILFFPLLLSSLFHSFPLVRLPEESPILFDTYQSLLYYKVNSEEQLFIPLKKEEIDFKIAISVITYEDEYFLFHPGINPVSLGKALGVNLKHRKILRGGSTITMQLARLSLHHKERTYWNKLVEICYALLLELRYSKKEILYFYLNEAPYGRNYIIKQRVGSIFQSHPGFSHGMKRFF